MDQNEMFRFLTGSTRVKKSGKSASEPTPAASSSVKSASTLDFFGAKRTAEATPVSEKKKSKKKVKKAAAQEAEGETKDAADAPSSGQNVDQASRGK